MSILEGLEMKEMLVMPRGLRSRESISAELETEGKESVVEDVLLHVGVQREPRYRLDDECEPVVVDAVVIVLAGLAARGGDQLGQESRGRRRREEPKARVNILTT